MLELKSINKTLGSLKLSDISLRINDGEYFVLLGPSGVGKTILIEIIAGLTRPDSGQILWNQQDITSNPPETRRFAVVYQDYALFPHLSVAGNITYGLKTAGADSKIIKTKLHSLADMLGITELLNRKPQTLSGGEQQRIALARALAAEPNMLLLDEPLSALDINTRVKLRKQLKRLSTELNIAFLHVTHDPQEAITLADRIAVMLDNQIRQVATPHQLFREPTDPDVAEFLGMKNLLPVDKVDDKVCLTCSKQIHASSADDSTSYIWIKPEEILLSKVVIDSSARNQFKCKVLDWAHSDSLLAVRIASDELILTALITYESFNKLQIKPRAELYAVFKSSAVHCF